MLRVSQTLNLESSPLTDNVHRMRQPVFFSSFKFLITKHLAAKVAAPTPRRDATSICNTRHTIKSFHQFWIYATKQKRATVVCASEWLKRGSSKQSKHNATQLSGTNVASYVRGRSISKEKPHDKFICWNTFYVCLPLMQPFLWKHLSPLSTACIVNKSQVYVFEVVCHTRQL